MKATTFHKFAILWLALWFGVIVPGHKRGLVLLPGGNDTPPATTASDKPCPLAAVMATNGSCCPSSSPSKAPAPGTPVTHCAICYLTGVLDVPPTPDLAHKPLELLQLLAWPTPEVVISAATTHTHPGRAPPIV